jgi:hypothetical protein
LYDGLAQRKLAVAGIDNVSQRGDLECVIGQDDPRFQRLEEAIPPGGLMPAQFLGTPDTRAESRFGKNVCQHGNRSLVE